ncbi:DDE-type integrase/transposase/recombinase [Streptomyces sp. NBC_01320]|uniref:DDE-type integrase/transposase/recombinase n=1 Tax=Streptomyces sp. NBC_01320 TaxID=2903824 RepID=UPI002E0F4F12|nr:hypothetical protein OG395_46805 [Streptomyces sp. NBC_01320]
MKRDFTAEASDPVWCGDMTEIVTEEDKFYLATFIDLFSRRLLGYAMGARHDADLPTPPDGNHEARRWFSWGQGYAKGGPMSSGCSPRPVCTGCGPGCVTIEALDSCLLPRLAAMARKVAEALKEPQPAPV